MEPPDGLEMDVIEWTEKIINEQSMDVQYRPPRTACRGFNLKVMNDLTEEADLHDNTKLYMTDTGHI